MKEGVINEKNAFINYSFLDSFGFLWELSDQINDKFSIDDYWKLILRISKKDGFNTGLISQKGRGNIDNAIWQVEEMLASFFVNPDYYFGSDDQVVSIFSILPISNRIRVLENLFQNYRFYERRYMTIVIDKLSKAYIKSQKPERAKECLNKAKSIGLVSVDFYENEKRSLDYLSLNLGYGTIFNTKDFEKLIFVKPVLSAEFVEVPKILPQFIDWYQMNNQRYQTFIDLFYLLMIVDKRTYIIDVDKEDMDSDSLDNDETIINKTNNALPFDPQMVDIISQPMVISNIVSRLNEDEIVLDPDFQRNSELWDDVKQSRLIESLIIKIPLPSFYFECTDDDKFIVVDGLQRLCALRRFMCKKEVVRTPLRLTGLEYFDDYSGKLFEDLPSSIQRRINETTIQVFVIRQGTPEQIRNSIFNRINTGGLHLEQAEIRNSVYRGPAADLLKELASNSDFLNATRHSIKAERMLDREFVNRFLAFYYLDVEKYDGNFEGYLCSVLSKLNKADSIEINNCRNAFERSMKLSVKLFGKNAFRKRTERGTYLKINKPLFDAVSTNLALLSDEEVNKLVSNKEKFIKLYEQLLSDESFINIISMATATVDNVKERHRKIREIIEEAFNDSVL